MTDILIEIGPGTVRGPNDAPAEWVSAGLECIDDEIALIDDHPVSVAEVWREVLRSILRSPAGTVVLVCPTWWASSRIDLVCDAARTMATEVVVLQRTRALCAGLPDRAPTVAEITGEFVVVTRPRAGIVVVPRPCGAEAVARRVDGATAVLVDAPAGVDGASALGAAIADRLRADSVAVSIADDEWVRRGAATLVLPLSDTPADSEKRPRIQLNRRGVAVLAGTVLSVAALCGGLAMRHDTSDPVAEDMPMTLLVEGRVGVKVPAQWSVQRITSGPGSARVQVVSSLHSDIAVHVTQSSIPSHQTQEMAAESLRRALNEQPLGVFVDFNPADRRVDRPAVTYREVRAGHHIVWAVLVDDALRIAIGCQSGPGREELVRDACDQAIQSAHAVF